MSNSSIWAIDRAQLGTITPELSEPGTDGNERVLRIHQSSSMTIRLFNTIYQPLRSGRIWHKVSF